MDTLLALATAVELERWMMDNKNLNLETRYCGQNSEPALYEGENNPPQKMCEFIAIRS